LRNYLPRPCQYPYSAQLLSKILRLIVTSSLTSLGGGGSIMDAAGVIEEVKPENGKVGFEHIQQYGI
jgi:hypothetical protein